MKRHRLRKKLPLIGALTALAVVVAAYVFGLAFFQSRKYAFYDFEDLIEPRVIDAVIASWLIYFCSSIGSFLNVVAWRMPRGDGIGGRSRCPRCANTLKTRDNIPILGWISLGGRCRFCSLPISRRYPIVETLVGLTLTAVGISQIYSLSIPGQAVHWHGGPLWSPRVSGTLLAILTYHTVALSTLWAMTLIRIDGTRLPRRLVLFSVVAVVAPMLAYPTLMIVPWQTNRPPGWIPDGLYVDAIMRVATAVVAAAFVARVLAKGLCPAADLKLDPLGRGTARLVDLIALLSVPAIVIGWQSLPGLVIVAAILSYLLRPLLDALPINDGPNGQLERRGALESFAFALPFALTLHLLFWRVLWSTWFWPSDQSSRNVMIVAALAVLVIPLFLKERATIAFSDVPPQGDTQPQGDAPPQSDAEMQGDAESQSEADTDADEDVAIADAADSLNELPSDHGDRETDDGDQRRDDSPSP